MNNQISYSIFLLYFLLCALHDSWKKAVPAAIFRIFLLLGLPVWLFRLQAAHSAGTLPDTLLAFLPGLLLLLLSRCTAQAIGSGDGLFLLIAGCFLDLRELLLLLATGIFLSGLWAILLLCRSRFRRCAAGKYTIPFIPCMLPGLYVIGSRILPFTLKELL